MKLRIHALTYYYPAEVMAWIYNYKTAIEVRAWMSIYIPRFYDYAITYPCSNLDVV